MKLTTAECSEIRLNTWLIASSLVLAAALAWSLPPDGKDPSQFSICRLKYKGGGDWYSNPSSLPNLLRAVRERLDIPSAREEVVREPGDPTLREFPFLYMNGHGNVQFSDEDLRALRAYLDGGGFLWADDNYGMDRYFREQMDRVLPGASFVELPFDHDVYHSFYEFPDGLPKIHEHDGGPPHGYGVFLDGRMVVFYSFNTDIGDGLEDEEVHNDPPEKREAALRMAVNIAVYALSH